MTRVALLFACLALTACGRNVCKKLEADADACGETWSDAQLDQCKEALSSCSRDDEKQLEDVYACREEKGMTEMCGDDPVDDPDQFVLDLQECAALAPAVSVECGKAVGIGTAITAR